MENSMFNRFINLLKNTILFLVLTITSCQAQREPQKNNTKTTSDLPILGAEQLDTYLPQLKGKAIAVVGNQTSVVPTANGYIHLVDTLVQLQQDVVKVFAPEHGFRGQADAGEKVIDSKDVKTGLPIISLYGNHKKPTPEDLADVDLVIFDIQDVGARFYTYISTLHYVMEACAEQGKPIIVLDRPNPNGHFIDGPILNSEFKSFVGMHPVPIVHGLTIGEYAQLINGEGWLKNKVKTNLSVVTLKNYSKTTAYDLPIKPSPNLPNAQAINLYPSLCFFEGTSVNAGRGTSKQFQIYGSPFLGSDRYDFTYTPQPNAGAKYPKHEGKLCYGEDLSDHKPLKQINLKWLIEAYQNTADQSEFFIPFFNKLAGNAKLQEQIKQGLDAEAIRATWKPELQAYREMVKPYLLY